MNENLQQATRLWTLAIPTVSAFITSLVRDFQARDDILQETAVAVMQVFDKFDPSRSFTGWAIGIAQNQVRLYYRRKNREESTFDPETLETLVRVFSEESPEDQRLEYLGDCINQLNRRSREFCRLRYEQQLKPAAIATQMGLSANNVAKTLQRIRDQLRRCIEQKTLKMESHS